MIVADTNLISYLFLPGPHTTEAREVYLRDPAWAAPILSRSEFRNVLARYLRMEGLSLVDAGILHAKAEELLSGREHIVPAGEVFRLVAASSCSAYDCEFVALAERLGVEFITLDRRILKDFPERALSPKQFLMADERR